MFSLGLFEEAMMTCITVFLYKIFPIYAPHHMFQVCGLLTVMVIAAVLENCLTPHDYHHLGAKYLVL